MVETLRREVEDSGISGTYLAEREQGREIPVVIDTGCSFSLTPFMSDFVTDLSPSEQEEMSGLSDSVAIKGVGWVEWNIRDVFGNVARVRTKAYYIPDARIRLLSTQLYFQENKAGNLTQDYQKVRLTTVEGQELMFPYQTYPNLRR